MSNPFISVIVPNYCHSKYLKQRLDSIINQTYQNFELIILDDCSPDNGASRSVIEQYRDNPHVSHIVYNEKNSGSTFIQWNKGFNLAKGEYIWMAESDDYAEPTFLEETVNSLKEHKNISIVHTTSYVVDSDSRLIYPYKDGSTLIREDVYSGADFINKFLSLSNGICNASAVMFRREYSLAVDHSYMSFKASGDHLFWILLAEKGSVIHLSETLNYFRIHTGKVTYRKSREGINHREEFEIYKYLKRKKYISGFKNMQVYHTFLNQILHNEYNSEDIRTNLLCLWRDEDRMMYLLVRLLIFTEFIIQLPRRIISCIIRIIRNKNY